MKGIFPTAELPNLCYYNNDEYSFNRPYSEKTAELVAEFMSQYGYNTEDSKKAVERLKERIRQLEDFPHEIGLFLSYPIEDVLGFIENRGKNYILNGYWKVYGNEEEARKSFFKYRKCTDVYHKLFMGGTPIEKLVRAAAY